MKLVNLISIFVFFSVTACSSQVARSPNTTSNKISTLEAGVANSEALLKQLEGIDGEKIYVPKNHKGSATKLLNEL